MCMKFCSNKSWGMQSNALDKSMGTVPASFLLSKDAFQISMILISTWLKL